MPADPPIALDSAFLTEVYDALRKRRRAFKHQGALPETERVIEVVEGFRQERLEIGFRPRARQRLGVSLRQDRTIRVQATESITKAGWKFDFTDSGRLAGHVDGRTLVGALEASIGAMFTMTAEDMSRMRGIWDPLIAKGPRAA